VGHTKFGHVTPNHNKYQRTRLSVEFVRVKKCGFWCQKQEEEEEEDIYLAQKHK